MSSRGSGQCGNQIGAKFWEAPGRFFVFFATFVSGPGPFCGSRSEALFGFGGVQFVYGCLWLKFIMSMWQVIADEHGIDPTGNLGSEKMMGGTLSSGQIAVGVVGVYG